MRQLNTSLPLDIEIRLRAAAKRLKVSRASIIRDGLLIYLPRLEEKIGQDKIAS